MRQCGDCQLLRTRNDALAAGAKRYFTGRPCKHGHVAERITHTRECIICKRLRVAANYARHREERLTYFKTYNRRRELAYFEHYNLEHAEERRAWARTQLK